MCRVCQSCEWDRLIVLSSQQPEQGPGANCSGLGQVRPVSMCQPDHHTHAGSEATTRSRPIVVVKTGRTYPELVHRCGDFEDWTVRGLGVASSDVAVVDVEADSCLPQPERVAAAVITGSHSMVTEGHGWLEPLAEWLRSLVEGKVPVLGVCFGHQLLGHAMGGRVGFHPEGPEIGTVEVDLLQEGEGDPLLGVMPRRFLAHATHEQSVLTLPDGAVLLARTDHDPHAAFRVGCCAWGVQFHPEYDEWIMRHYVREQKATLEAQGRDADRVESEVRSAATGGLLSRFVELSSGHFLGHAGAPAPGGASAELT